MRLSQSAFDSVKQLCSEMLVELLQHESPVVLEMKGLEVVMHAIRQAISRCAIF